MDVRFILAVAAGGALGALARRGLNEWLPGAGGTHGWPWATFAANLVGAAVLGVLLAAVAHLPARMVLLRPFLGAGFCGALTTFSTLQLELIRLGRDGHVGLAAAYVGASLAGGLALAAIGWQALAPARARGTGPGAGGASAASGTGPGAGA